MCVGYAYLEEEPNDEDLQRPHADNKATLDQAKVDDSPLGVFNRVEVSVLSGAEVLLVSGDGGDLAGDLVDGLLHNCRALRRGALLGRQLCPRFILDLEHETRSVPWARSSKRRGGSTYGNLEVDEFIGSTAHLVAEAELVVSHIVGCEDKVSLPFLLPI